MVFAVKDGSLTEDGKPKTRYVQFKITNLDHENQERKIIQIIDMSASILYI